MGTLLSILSAICVERFISASLVFTGFTEQGGNNKGQAVGLFLRGTGLPEGYPWCAAFVYHIGHWSQYDEATRKSKWPLPATAGCKDLGIFAKKKGVLLTAPERGDVFLTFNPELDGGRFSHTGIVLSAKQASNGTFTCQTIEGNTNAAGSREEDSVVIKNRTFDTKRGDRFIRWRNLI